MDWELFWWKETHGPRAFIKAIAECAACGESAQVVFTGGLSLRKSMRNAVRDAIVISDTMREIDATQISDGDIGTFLVHEYTNREKYRPNREHWSDYLKRKGVLNSLLLWIYSVGHELESELAESESQLRSVCAYILETDNEEFQLEGVRRIDAGSYITEYDYLLLASRVAAEKGDVSGSWQRYIADLAMELYSGDSERVVSFVEQFDANCMPSDYDMAASDASVWKAQLRNVFHHIEEERNAFIDRNKQAIADCLPVTQYYQVVTDPYDCELGLLWSLTFARQSEDGVVKRLLLPTADKEELYFLYSSRNQLAHNKCLSPDEMKRLLN